MHSAPVTTITTAWVIQSSRHASWNTCMAESAITGPATPPADADMK